MLELWTARTLLKSKNATDAHNLDSTKPANVEPEVEIGGFDMSFLDVDALQQARVWMVADDWGVIRVRGVQAPVCKPLLSVGVYTSMGGVSILYGDKGYLFHKCSNVAKKFDAWIQKEMRDSQHHNCTVAHKENNVCNIYMKPKGN